jgi:hypothetical protein
MSDRYSKLSKFTIEEQAEICVMLCNFFSPLQEIEMRKILNLPREKGKLIPLTFLDFLEYSKVVNYDLWPYMQRVKELLSKLVNESIIQAYSGIDINGKFLFFREHTQRESLGNLWLGSVLKEEFIGNEIQKDIAYIEGKTLKGDISVGTGILVSSKAVLTCAHVVDDMKLDEYIQIGGRKVKVEETISHDKVDVGLVFLNESIDSKLPDLAFRNSALLESVVIAGFPSVPRSLEPCYTLQRGEISGHLDKTMDLYPMDLFSAIARPGNSGGPVVGLDGCILGIVTRSLERQTEEADAMLTMPFFAAVPSRVIAESISEISNNRIDLKWENYA